MIELLDIKVLELYMLCLVNQNFDAIKQVNTDDLMLMVMLLDDELVKLLNVNSIGLDHIKKNIEVFL